MEDRDQFELWMSQWDAAAKELNAEPPKPAQPPTSFFNNAPSYEDYGTGDFNVTNDNDIVDDDWLDIYQRAMEVEDCLLAEDANTGLDAGDDENRDGFSHMVRGDKQMTKGNITYPQNPIDTHTVGPDSGKEGGPIRVTKNWNSGKELDEVDRLRHDILTLEREFYKADLFNKKSERSSLQKQLESLRDRVNSLSEKMQPQTDKDVT